MISTIICLIDFIKRRDIIPAVLAGIVIGANYTDTHDVPIIIVIPSTIFLGLRLYTRIKYVITRSKQ